MAVIPHLAQCPFAVDLLFQSPQGAFYGFAFF
jgi:hypothetical protein